MVLFYLRLGARTVGESAPSEIIICESISGAGEKDTQTYIHGHILLTECNELSGLPIKSK